jgi:hypothetical protein
MDLKLHKTHPQARKMKPHPPYPLKISLTPRGGPPNEKIFGPPVEGIVGALDEKISGPLDEKLVGPTDEKLVGPLDGKVVGPLGEKIVGPLDENLDGPLESACQDVSTAAGPCHQAHQLAASPVVPLLQDLCISKPVSYSSRR